MKLLALEMSSELGSVALLNGSALTERWIETPREQTERVLELSEQLLTSAGLTLGELDAIVFGRGPGSFTGLRVAGAVAQGLAMSAARPVLAVSSLAALAQHAWRVGRLEHTLVCVDARMREVYWGAFSVVAGRAQAQGPERLGDPEQVALPGQRDWGAVGSGFAAYREALAPLTSAASVVLPELRPTAADLLPQAQADLASGRVLAPEEALPVYLRDETAWRRHS